MTEEERKLLTNRLCENLTILRLKLGLSQEELGDKIGVSRFTVAAFENKKREMPWNTFLALLMVFTKNNETNELLKVFNIYTSDLSSMLKSN